MASETLHPSKRILVADDDPETLRLMRSLIEAEGCTMISASDGREAYRILSRDNDFLVCVFDRAMPYLGGPELLGYMQTENRFKRIPKVIMAEENRSLPSGSFAAGATAYLPKPISPSQMQALLQMLVNSGGARQAPTAWLAK